METQVHVAFLWHMHQPWYALPASDENLLPWTRLRGTKDYTDMAAWLERWPVPVTVNFTPSLTEQLRRYGEGTLTDHYLPSRTNAAAFADLRAGHVPLPTARRGLPAPDLNRLRAERGDDAEQALLGWSLLAWLGQSILEEDRDLQALWTRGSFSPADLVALEKKHQDVLAQVLPRYRRLAAQGAIELSATPFYHPILPLVLDSSIAHRCQPGNSIPPFSAPEDAEEQVRRALRHHESTFGQLPAGMWPAEGAVSAGTLALLARCGVRWAATDGGILAQTLGRPPRPEELYRPWRLATPDGEIVLLFRDTFL
ncbi:MAG: glycoside hydrolase, partial [Candidatus Bipolaricaulota bacterium]|nr:glycoside hydrolase [Candidatus Bipolaricaulota bacterium]